MRHVHNVNCQDSAQAQIERQLREIDNLNYNQVKAGGITAIEGGESVSNSFGWQRVRLEFMDPVQPSATSPGSHFEYLAANGNGIHLGH